MKFRHLLDPGVKKLLKKRLIFIISLDFYKKRSIMKGYEKERGTTVWIL